MRYLVGSIAWYVENLEWHCSPKFNPPQWFWTAYFKVWHVAYRIRYWAYIGHPYWKSKQK